MTQQEIQFIQNAVKPRELAEHLNIEIFKNTIRCPFHNDNKPSMFLYDDSFKCFACGERANTIQFLRQYLNLSFNKALEYIVKFKDLNINLSTNSEKKHIDWLNIVHEVNKEIQLMDNINNSYHQYLLNEYDKYLAINNEYGYLKEEYNTNITKNETIWFEIQEYGLDAIVKNHNYFNHVKNTLKNNWIIIKFEDFVTTFQQNKTLANEIHNLINQTGF